MDVDVSVGQRRDPCGVGEVDCSSFSFQLFDGCLNVDRIPIGDHVEDEVESAEFLRLGLSAWRIEFTALAVADMPGEFVAVFVPVELGENAAASVTIADEIEDVDGLDDTPQLTESFGECGWPVPDLQHMHDAGRLDLPHSERGSQSQEIVPALNDELDVDAVSGERIERTVVGRFVDTPEASTADIGKSGAELITEKPEKGEDNIAVSCRIGHDLGGLEVSFLLQQQSEDHHAVPQGSRHRDAADRPNDPRRDCTR